MKAFFERLYFAPRWYHYPFITLLLPLSFLYGAGMRLRRLRARKERFDVPIISVGNLIVGGSGKTPFVIALASEYEKVAIVSRGYGRQSRGLVEVSRKGEILCNVTQSGDEPMLMARALPHADVIVSEDRKEGIHKAIANGAEMIILDDGFNRVDIEKYDILLEPESITNYYTFPAGPFREFVSTRTYADLILKEGREYHRQVTVENPAGRMVLVTAIAHPQRLDPYLPEGVVAKVYKDDHAYFDEEELKRLLQEHHADAILCTSKDRVKMEGFKLPVSEMKLKLEINKKSRDQIAQAIDQYRQGKRE